MNKSHITPNEVHLRRQTTASLGGDASAYRALRLSVMATGISLGLFLAISFILCIALAFIFPNVALHTSRVQFLPGFTWLTWPSFFLGLCESFAYGFYTAIVLVPLYIFFARVGADWW